MIARLVIIMWHDLLGGNHTLNLLVFVVRLAISRYCANLVVATFRLA